MAASNALTTDDYMRILVVLAYNEKQGRPPMNASQVAEVTLLNRRNARKRLWTLHSWGVVQCTEDGRHGYRWRLAPQTAWTDHLPFSMRQRFRAGL